VTRGKDILRLPVITRDTGKRVGDVADLVLDRGGSRVLGLVLGEKKILSSARVVAWPAVLVAGRDAVIIDSEKSVVKASAVPEIKEVLDRGFILRGSRVGTTAGRELGKIETFFFNTATGAVEGYELKGGAGDQLASKRAFMPAHPSFESGKDYTFVDPVAADAIVDLKAALKARRTS
jgi:uncharacterized protein YrrD